VRENKLGLDLCFGPFSFQSQGPSVGDNGQERYRSLPIDSEHGGPPECFSSKGILDVLWAVGRQLGTGLRKRGTT
jgi:hypothetical protein